MSRHNEIILYGKMHKDPLIRLTDDGDFVMARFSLDTIIGDRDMQSYVDKLRYQQPWILARDSEIIEKISDGEYALYSLANGKYVQANLNDGGKLFATSETVAGAWEVFDISRN